MTLQPFVTIQDETMLVVGRSNVSQGHDLHSQPQSDYDLGCHYTSLG